MRQREKIVSGGRGRGGEEKEARGRRAEKKPSSHRANEPIFSHLARPDGRTDGRSDGRTDGRSGKKTREDGGGRAGGRGAGGRQGEEAAMNFALPEDVEARGRGRARRGGRGG